MIPIRLHLRNFLSYRGSVIVEFDGLGLACLSGENGAGKSALLDAMTWAIWGESRAQRDVELISLGESESEVTFEFRMGQREYRVMRRRTQSRPTLEFDARAPGTTNWLPIGGDAIRDTQERIVRELRLDYDTFANSAFLRQGQADLFTQNKPSERKRILAEILDLSGYDNLVDEARAERRTRTQRLDAIQSQIGRIDLQLASRHEKEVELAELDDSVSQTEERLEALGSAIDSMRDRLSAAEMAESLLVRTNERIARLKQQTEEVAGSRKAAENQISSLKGFLSKETKIVARVEDKRKWRKLADEQSHALSTRQPLLARKQEIERQIRQCASDLERQMALLRQSIGTQEQQITDLDRKFSEAKHLEAQLAKNRTALARLPEVNAELERLQGSVTELTGENASLHSRMKDIQSRIAALTDGDATCPVCRRPLGAGDHAHIQEEWTAEGRELGDKFRTNRAKIEALNTEIKQKRQELAELDKLGRSTAAVEANLTQLKSDLSKQQETKTSLLELRKNATAIDEQISKGSFLDDQRKELAQLEKRLAEVPYDEQVHKEARERSQDLEAAEREFQKLERARADIDGFGKQVKDFDARLDEIAGELKEAEQDATKLAKSLDGIAEVRANHQRATQERQQLAGSLAEMERRRGGLRRQLEELDELEKEHSRLREESKRLAAETDAYGELMTAFGRNGIQAMVIENVLPELEDEANRILSRMTTKQLEVQFRTTREAVSSDSTIETLDIIIRDESGRRPYQMFSGGEAFRINFAIRVALSKLLARRAGASVDTLIIDEGFGTQDQHGRDGLIEAIQSVTRDFELILVITHVDELRNQFPHRIEIVKTDAGSRATLI